MGEELTVGDLRRQLEGLSDDTVLSFPGHLTFYRLKRWGDNEFIVEFNEPVGDLSPAFKKKNPRVKVVFINIDDVAWDESGMISEGIDVTVR